MDELQAEIERLEERDRMLTAELCQIRNEVDAKRLILVRDKYSIDVGSIVISKGKEYRVESIEPKQWDGKHGKPWLVGNPRRKDGSFGSAPRNLFDYWEKAAEQSQ